MVEEMIAAEEEKGGFMTWLKSKFHKEEEEEPQYKRKLLDGRIEKFLDQNFNSYVQEYGIVTGLDIEAYEERYVTLTGRITNMREYMLEADASLSSMEKDIKLIKAESKKKRR